MLMFIEPQYWLAYGIFFSALIVTIRTDFESMLISRFMTWGMLPLALYFSMQGALPITPLESIAGAVFGYAILWIIAQLFYKFRKIEGMGQGDLDLLAMIGAYTGILGAWISLFIGSLLGSLVGLILTIKLQRPGMKIPFGPWLAAGAIIYVFFRELIIQLMHH